MTWSSRMISHEKSYLESFFHKLYWEIQKVKYDLTSCKRNADKSKKLVKTSTTTFPLWCHLNLLKKKVVLSLSGYRPVEQWHKAQDLQAPMVTSRSLYKAGIQRRKERRCSNISKVTTVSNLHPSRLSNPPEIYSL